MKKSKIDGGSLFVKEVVEKICTFAEDIEKLKEIVRVQQFAHAKIAPYPMCDLCKLYVRATEFRCGTCTGIFCFDCIPQIMGEQCWCGDDICANCLVDQMQCDHCQLYFCNLNCYDQHKDECE